MSGFRNTLFPILGALALAGCASVPPDAGLGDVQRVIRDRAHPAPEWSPQVRDRDDERVRELLAGELDADQAVTIALLNNPRVQVVLAELGIARAELISASTIRNPLLGAEIRSRGGAARPVELTLTQTLFDLVQLPRRRRAGRATFEAAKQRTAAELLDFAAGVRADYYRVVAAAQSLAMDRTIVEAAASGAELAQRQHAAGNITDLDLENEQARYERAKLGVARSEEEALLRREALIRAMALRDSSLEFTIAAQFPPPPPAESLAADLVEAAASRRLDIAAARHEVEALERLLPVSRLAEIGELAADYHVEREPDGTRTGGPGVELPVPLFNRGRAGRARTEAQLVRSRQRLALLNGALASELRSVQDRLVAARARMEYYRDVVLPRRRRIVELTQLAHNAMAVGIFQLLQARQDEADERRAAIRAELDYWLARIDLDRAVNGGGSDLLRMPSAANDLSGDR